MRAFMANVFLEFDLSPPVAFYIMNMNVTISGRIGDCRADYHPKCSSSTDQPSCHIMFPLYQTGIFNGKVFLDKHEVGSISVKNVWKPAVMHERSFRVIAPSGNVYYNSLYANRTVFMNTSIPLQFDNPHIQSTQSIGPPYQKMNGSSCWIQKIYDEHWRYLLLQHTGILKCDRVFSLSRSKNDKIVLINKKNVDYADGQPKLFDKLTFMPYKSLSFTNHSAIKAILANPDFSSLKTKSRRSSSQPIVALSEDLQAYIPQLTKRIPDVKFVSYSLDDPIDETYSTISNAAILCGSHFEHTIHSIFLPSSSYVIDLSELRNARIFELKNFITRVLNLKYIRPKWPGKKCTTFNCYSEYDGSPIIPEAFDVLSQALADVIHEIDSSIK